MTPRCGIDTSILVRLTTCEPAQDFDRVVAALTHLVEVDHVALFASHMVIGEARVALQHHYGVGKRDAQAGLRSVPSSGRVTPSGGDPVLDALATYRGCGLLDRLIVLQHGGDDPGTLTLDRKMAALPSADRFAIGADGRGQEQGALRACARADRMSTDAPPAPCASEGRAP